MITILKNILIIVRNVALFVFLYIYNIMTPHLLYRQNLAKSQANISKFKYKIPDKPE